MGGREEESFQEMGCKKNGVLCDPVHLQWVIMEAEDDPRVTESMESSIGEDSDNNSAASVSSSLELEEDASSSSSDSSPTSASSSVQYGPLYELSDLMNQLPIKRGLSKHYQGKSQSFTSLANAQSLEDLAKKVGSFSQRMKSCKSYGGLDGQNKYRPKVTIAKKPLRGSSFSSFIGSSKGSFVGSFRHPISLCKGIVDDM